MSWITTAGVGVATGFAGAVSAGMLTYLFVEWYGLRRNDGADLGYYLFFIPVGIVCGIAIGLAVSRLRATGMPLVESLGAIALVCGLIGFLGWLGRTATPPPDPNRLVLELEVKYGTGWKLAGVKRLAQTERNCELNDAGATQPSKSVSTIGWVNWPPAKADDGRRVVSCAVDLRGGGDRQVVHLRLGDTQTEFEVLAPANRQEHWSDWTARDAFAHRQRVRRAQELEDDVVAAQKAVWEERDQRAAAIRPEDPMEKWLPLFEAPDGSPIVWRWGGQERIERKAVEPRIKDLLPLLGSKDKTIRRQALYVVGAMNAPPAGVRDAVEEAGPVVVEFIESARVLGAASEDAGDVAAAERQARFCFGGWKAAVDMTAGGGGPARSQRYREILTMIENAARESGLKGEVATVIAADAKAELQKLAAEGK